MVFLTDRDLERLVGLRANWRKNYLDEVARLLQNNVANRPLKLKMSAQVNDMEEAERLAGAMLDVEVVECAARDLNNPRLSWASSDWALKTPAILGYRRP
jgi:hypothetical protein